MTILASALASAIATGVVTGLAHPVFGWRFVVAGLVALALWGVTIALVYHSA